MAKHNVINPDLECWGWKTYLQQRRGTSKITINKLVVVGAGLEKGQPLYCFLGKDNDGRPILVTYLDGKGRKPVSVDEGKEEKNEKEE